MTITTRDQLISALGNNYSQFQIDKANVANAASTQLISMWRATGQPAQGAIPTTTSALCDNTLTGCIPFTQQTAPATSYIGALIGILVGQSTTSIEIHDRIAHMGGLAFNVFTPTVQTITGLDLNTLAPSAARRGATNFSDLQWWLEVYGDGGATASNATVNVTYNDNSTGNLNLIAVGGTLRIGRMIGLTQFIPAAQQGLFIRGINSVVLSASTTVAGNFGFTCTRIRAVAPFAILNKPENYDWAQLGMPEVPNGSCLMLAVQASTTSTGVVRGQGKIVHG
jgi:hypothetical protein